MQTSVFRALVEYSDSLQMKYLKWDSDKEEYYIADNSDDEDPKEKAPEAVAEEVEYYSWTPSSAEAEDNEWVGADE